MIWEIYSYWNTEMFANIFQGIALILNNSGYHELFVLGATLGTLFALIASMSGKGSPIDIAKYVLIGALFFWMLIIPRTQVVIIDKSYLTQNAAPSYVGDIPLSLAFLAHTTSSFGQWVDESFTTFFGTPADLQASGTHMSRRIMMEMALARPESAITLHNIGEYTRECVVYDLNTGAKSIKDIEDAGQTWAELGGTNPAIFVTMTEYDAATGTTASVIQDCPTAYSYLNTIITSESDNVLTTHAQTAFPNMTNVAAKAAYSAVVTSSMAHFMSNNTLSAQAVFENAVVQNAFLSEMGELSGNPISIAKAIKGVDEGSNQKEELAKSFFFTLTIVQLIAYALFPIVALFVVVSGVNGLKPLLMLVKVLVWLGLVQGMQIIIDELLIMNASAEARNAIGAATGGSINAWMQAGGIINGMEDQLQNALFASLALSWGLVHLGGMSGSSVAQGIFGGAQVYNERTATDLAAEGKNSFGSTDYMNKSMFNSSGFKSNMALESNNYGARVQGSDGTITNTTGTGTQSSDVTALDNKGGALDGKIANGVSQRAERQSQKLTELAKSQRAQAEKSQDSAISKSAANIDAAEVGKVTGTGLTTQQTKQAEKVYQQMDDVSKKISETFGVSKAAADAFVARTMFGGGLNIGGKDSGGLLSFGAKQLGLHLKAGAEGTEDTELRTQAMRDLKDLKEGTNKESLANAKKVAETVARDQKLQDTVGVKDSDQIAIKGDLSDASRFSKQAEVNQRQAESYSELNAYMEQKSRDLGVDVFKGMDNNKYEEIQLAWKNGDKKTAYALAEQQLRTEMGNIGQTFTPPANNSAQHKERFEEEANKLESKHNNSTVTEIAQGRVKAAETAIEEQRQNNANVEKDLQAGAKKTEEDVVTGVNQGEASVKTNKEEVESKTDHVEARYNAQAEGTTKEAIQERHGLEYDEDGKLAKTTYQPFDIDSVDGKTSTPISNSDKNQPLRAGIDGVSTLKAPGSEVKKEDSPSPSRS